MLGVIAKKLGMTQVFKEDGAALAVTVLQVSPNQVVQIKTPERDGYSALQVATNEQKEHRLTKAELGHFKKHGTKNYSHVKEFRCDDVAEFKEGQTFDSSVLNAGDAIHIRGKSKGKGFQGVMKRHNFSGGNDSHGASVSHRVPGSIGQGTFPGRVIKGKKLAGHMGDEWVTVKNLEIVGVEADQGLVLVKGAVPGSKNSFLYVYPQDPQFPQRLLTSGDDKEAGAESKGEAGNEQAA